MLLDPVTPPVQELKIPVLIRAAQSRRDQMINVTRGRGPQRLPAATVISVGANAALTVIQELGSTVLPSLRSAARAFIVVRLAVEQALHSQFIAALPPAAAPRAGAPLATVAGVIRTITGLIFTHALKVGRTPPLVHRQSAFPVSDIPLAAILAPLL